MKLKAVTVQLFRNFVKSQRIVIEEDVTGLVGKNESGKTTVLQALHRLKPANGTSKKFDLTTEYPRWRLAHDRKANPNLVHIAPVTAEFSIDPDDLVKLNEAFHLQLPSNVTLLASKSYANEYDIQLYVDLKEAISLSALEASVDNADLDLLLQSTRYEEVLAFAREQAKALKQDQGLRSKAVASFIAHFSRLEPLFSGQGLSVEQKESIWELIPSFFYFSNYNILPGECDLYDLSEKIKNGNQLTDSERTVVSLLRHAGEEPQDFMDENYASRKAELQAASADLSSRVFTYWRQNTDLSVVFDTDNIVVDTDPSGNHITHRILKIELRDARHGGVETNFSTRSTGFQWFFSFFAAFSEYQELQKPLIVLLDEPGTSLHGEAQQDYIRFIFEELGSSKQTIYTTHAQHMVDPAQYEKLRAVHDQATRENPDLGVVVSNVDLSADKSTLLPLESALGYSVSQHLFLGSGQHLAVEGSSDFIYMQRFTEHFISINKVGLDPRLTIIPVGGIDNMPAFVALLGRRLKVSALVDGATTNNKLARIKKAAKANGVPESHIVACSEVSGVPTNADIEDLFAPEDYLRLYNWAFKNTVERSRLAATNEPIIKRIEDAIGEFDHALPAHALTEHRDEFYSTMNPIAISHFEELFKLLNATVE